MGIGALHNFWHDHIYHNCGEDYWLSQQCQIEIRKAWKLALMRWNGRIDFRRREEQYAFCRKGSIAGWKIRVSVILSKIFTFINYHDLTIIGNWSTISLTKFLPKLVTKQSFSTTESSLWQDNKEWVFCQVYVCASKLKSLDLRNMMTRLGYDFFCVQ